jgi:hypothetical protein
MIISDGSVVLSCNRSESSCRSPSSPRSTSEVILQLIGVKIVFTTNILLITAVYCVLCERE